MADFDVEIFIELVRDRPILYQRSHVNYKSTALKNKAWREILDELNDEAIKDIKELQKKWIELRKRFYEALKAHSNRMRGRGGSSKKWPYFECMRFIKDCNYKRRATSGNLQCHTVYDSLSGWSGQSANTNGDSLTPRPRGKIAMDGDKNNPYVVSD